MRLNSKYDLVLDAAKRIREWATLATAIKVRLGTGCGGRRNSRVSCLLMGGERAIGFQIHLCVRVTDLRKLIVL